MKAMLKRRFLRILWSPEALLVAVGLGLVVGAALAEPIMSVRRIGYLGPPPTPATEHLRHAFVEALREHGWVEGRNLVIERRYFEAADERLPRLAAELVRLEVELIVSLTTPAALAARTSTDSLPIVTVTGDPVDSGLAASYARPGGNVTGLTHIPSDEWLGKLLSLLKEAAPRVRRVAVLGNSTNPAEARTVSNAEAAARALGLTLVALEVRSAQDFEAAFAAARHDRLDGLFAHDSPLNFAYRQRIADFALRERLPSVFGNREFAAAGGLLSYSPSLVHQFRRAAFYVDRILRGALPAELPIERPDRFEMVANLRTARALAVTLPASLRLRVDTVIE